jgi:hypothetical protein
MRQIFNDPHIEAKFRDHGFVVVPLLTQSEIPELKQTLLNLKPSDDYKGNQNTLIGRQSFHITFFDADTEYKKQVFEFLKRRLSSAAQTFLKDYKCAQANVFLKPVGAGIVYPHQNITITDEEKYTSVSFWIPLQDTSSENGTVCVIPGSQDYFVKYRNTHIYWPYVKFFKDGPGLNYFVPVNVKAGELLILDDRIVHYTPINKSLSDRWVVHSLWAPSEAQLKFCDPVENEVKVYDVEDDFWQFHPPGKMITEVRSGHILPNTEHTYSEKELFGILEKLKNDL